MPKNQLIYNQVGVFVGPAPSSGYHFIDPSGYLNNRFYELFGNHNLIFPLNRITSLSYSIQPPRQEIINVSKLGTLKRPILNDTTVDLNFSYNLMGLVNDARIGLYLNTPSGDIMTGNYRYGTGRVCPIYGMYSRDFSRVDDPQTLNWPLVYRDCRNIFVAARKNSDDFNFLTGTLYSGLPYNQEIYTYSFGDCYLNSYNFSVAHNQLPNVSVNYTCNNLEVYSSGLALDIPSINTQTQNIYSGIRINIPNNYQKNEFIPTVLIPSDISITIKQNSNNSQDLDDCLVDFNDIKIQNMSFNFNLNRKPLYAIGHKYPTDRIPSFPVFCDLNIGCVAGDPKAGSLINLLKRDDNYDITVNLNYQRNRQFFTGIAIEYKFINSKFNGAISSISLDSLKTINLNFTTEMNPNDTTKGLFIKGNLGMWSWDELVLALFYPGETGRLVDYFLAETGIGVLLGEDFNEFVLDSPFPSGILDFLTTTNDKVLVEYVMDELPRPVF